MPWRNPLPAAHRPGAELDPQAGISCAGIDNRHWMSMQSGVDLRDGEVQSCTVITSDVAAENERPGGAASHAMTPMTRCGSGRNRLEAGGENRRLYHAAARQTRDVARTVH